MDSALFLRLATSRDKEGILALAREKIIDKSQKFLLELRKRIYLCGQSGIHNCKQYSLPCGLNCLPQNFEMLCAD